MTMRKGPGHEPQQPGDQRPAAFTIKTSENPTHHTCPQSRMAIRKWLRNPAGTGSGSGKNAAYRRVRRVFSAPTTTTSRMVSSWITDSVAAAVSVRGPGADTVTGWRGRAATKR